MKPLKRFFLYCFYCTVAYFTKGHPAHGAYKISATSVNSRNVYSNSSTAGCTSYVVPGYNAIAGTEKGTCGATGASFMTYNPAVSCATLSKDSDGVCTLGDCSWECEIGCPKEYWGKTILYTELESTTCTETLGPACPVGSTFQSLYSYSWCNACPDYGTCNGGEKFTCTDYENKEFEENNKTNNCDIICSTVPGARICDGDEVTECKSGFYEQINLCWECRPWEICPQGDDNGGVLGCKVNDSSYTGEAYSGTGTGVSEYIYGPYYLHDNGCHACPDHAECDQETFTMTCNDGYYRAGSSATWSGVGAVGGYIERQYDTYVCKKCPAGGNCYDNVLQSCNDGYYKSDTECIKCTGNAATCNANGALSCNSNYYLLGKECVKCPDNATCYDNGTWTCNEGFYKTNNGCQTCPEHYKTCTNDGFTCQDGYFSNGTACPACETAFAHAITCTAVAATSCRAGYYLSAGQCAPCPANSTCTSYTNFTCNNGFYKSNKACVTCPTNHKTCNNEGFTCKDGYYRSGDKCEQCQGVGVATCTADGATSCTDNYFFNDGQCLDCPENATCDSDGFTCKDGYFKKDAGCASCPEYAYCTSGEFKGCWTGASSSSSSSSSSSTTGTDATGSGTSGTGYSAYYGDENGCYPCPANALCYVGCATGICQTGFYGIVSGTGAVCTQCPQIGGSEYGDTRAYSGAKTVAECFANVGKSNTYEDRYGKFYYASVNTQSSGTGTGTGSSESSGYYTGGMCFYGGI